MKTGLFRTLLIGVSCAFNPAASTALAQDPGEWDSIIVLDVAVDNTVDSIYVPIYLVTDDSVATYNVPLRFSFGAGGINFARIEYIENYFNWDENFDDYIAGADFTRMIGFHDLGGADNEPLNTNSSRVHYMDMVFAVEPGTPDQAGRIDTAYDDINGSMFLGLADGVTGFTPVFVPATITFGDYNTVPTLSEWGMIVLFLLLLAGGTVGVVRKFRGTVAAG